MAATISNEFSELLKCTVCDDIFKKPKCLPCIHTFCLDCLRGNVTKSEEIVKISCPLCREKFSISSERLDNLPDNLFIQRMIEMNRKIEKLGQGAGIKCDICQEEKDDKISSPASKYCVECDQNLCQTCGDWHSRMKYLKSHHVIPVGGQDIPESQMDVPMYCDKHKTDPLRIYCVQCDVVVCTICMISEHNGHDYQEIVYVSDKFRIEFDLKISKLNDRMKVINDTSKYLKITENRVIEESFENDQKIKKRCKELKELIENFEKQLLDESKKIQDKKITALKTTMNAFKCWCQQLRSYAAYLEELKKNGSYCDVACCGKKLMTTVDNILTKSEAMLKVPETANHEFIVHSGDGVNNQLLGKIVTSGGKSLITLGLEINGSIQNTMCAVNLNKIDTVSVNDSAPSEIGLNSAACVMQNDLYVVGKDRTLMKWPLCRDVWKKCASIPSPVRREYSLCSAGDKLFLLGGWSDAANTILDGILCYDINKDEWNEAGDLFRAVIGATCVTFEECIYVFGGSGKTGKVNYVQIYNIITQTCSLGSNSMPAADSQLRAVLWKSKALLIGEDTCYIYDFTLDLWQERQRFKTSLLHFGLTIYCNTLYISGGGTCQRDEHNRATWTCSDQVKWLSVDDLLSDNEEAKWMHHATLPYPALIHAYSDVPLMCEIRPPNAQKEQDNQVQSKEATNKSTNQVQNQTESNRIKQKK